MHNCPSCDSHNWPAHTLGLRVCPACNASIVFEKTGRDTISARIYRDKLTRQSILTGYGNGSRVAGPDYISRLRVLRERLRNVPTDDLTVLCAACARPTPLYSYSPDITPAIDGAITLDTPTLMQVQTGVNYDGSRLVPVFESRLMRPSRIRGYICADCANTFSAVAVRNQDADQTKRRADKRGSVIRPATYNTTAQRIDADIALIEIERAKSNMRAMVPDWALQDAAVAATASPDGPCWAHTFDGRWLGQACIYFGHRRRHASMSDPKVPTLWRPESFSEPTGTFDPIEHIDHAIYVGPATAHRWTGRLARTIAKSDYHVWLADSRPEAATPRYTLRPYLAARLTVQIEPTPRQTLRRCAHGLTLGCALCLAGLRGVTLRPSPMPKQEPRQISVPAPIDICARNRATFHTRPLPRRAIPLRLT